MTTRQSYAIFESRDRILSGRPLGKKPDTGEFYFGASLGSTALNSVSDISKIGLSQSTITAIDTLPLNNYNITFDNNVYTEGSVGYFSISNTWRHEISVALITPSVSMVGSGTSQQASTDNSSTQISHGPSTIAINGNTYNSAILNARQILAMYNIYYHMQPDVGRLGFFLGAGFGFVGANYTFNATNTNSSANTAGKNIVSTPDPVTSTTTNNVTTPNEPNASGTQSIATPAYADAAVLQYSPALQALCGVIFVVTQGIAVQIKARYTVTGLQYNAQSDKAISVGNQFIGLELGMILKL